MTKRKTPELPYAEKRALEDRRHRQRQFFADKGAVDDCLEELAEGVPLTGWCEARGFASSTIRMWLAANRPAEYESVRITVADGVLDEIAELEREMQRALRGGGIDPATGEMVEGAGIDRDKASYFRELLKTKMWRVEKLNPARYGQRQNIDMRVTDVNKQHLDAVRELSRLARETRTALPSRVIEGELVSVAAPEAIAAIPLAETSLPSLTSVSTQPAETTEPAQPDESVTPAVPGRQAMVAETALPAVSAVLAEVASTVLPTIPTEAARSDRPANSWVKAGLSPTPVVRPGAPSAASRTRPSFIIPTPNNARK